MNNWDPRLEGKRGVTFMGKPVHVACQMIRGVQWRRLIREWEEKLEQERHPQSTFIITGKTCFFSVSLSIVDW